MSLYPRSIAIPHGPTIELLEEDSRGLAWRCGVSSGFAQANDSATAEEVAIYTATFAYVRVQLADIRNKNEETLQRQIDDLRAELAKARGVEPSGVF